jgi:hypothetical protein
MSDEKLLLDKSFYMRESKTVEIATWFSSGYTTALMDSFIDATASEPSGACLSLCIRNLYK